MRALVVLALLATSVLAGCAHPSSSQPVVCPAKSAAVNATVNSSFPWHSISSTVFWIGEPSTADNDQIDNVASAWDPDWQAHFGGVDDPDHRAGWCPAGFAPRLNPFYVALPYDDFLDNGTRKSDAASVVPWSAERAWGPHDSMVRGHWLQIEANGRTAFAQWEDAGPVFYDDAAYVFGTAPPKNTTHGATGMDVSPAVRDALGFDQNGDNPLRWRFVPAGQVPPGSWLDLPGG